MPTTLFVDHLQGNYSQVGRVINLDKIQRILKLIDADVDMLTDKVAEFNNAQHICRAGRFLISTSIMLDKPEYKYVMSITDANNDRQLAMAFIATVDPGLKGLASDLVNQLTHLSDAERNKFEMVVGNG